MNLPNAQVVTCSKELLEDCRRFLASLEGPLNVKVARARNVARHFNGNT